MYLSVLVAAAGLAAAAKPADEEAILAAAREAREASRTYDVAKLEPILADDFPAIDSSGQLQVTAREVRVRQYGNVAVVTELRDVKGAPRPQRRAIPRCG